MGRDKISLNVGDQDFVGVINKSESSTVTLQAMAEDTGLLELSLWGTLVNDGDTTSWIDCKGYHYAIIKSTGFTTNSGELGLYIVFQADNGEIVSSDSYSLESYNFSDEGGYIGGTVAIDVRGFAKLRLVMQENCDSAKIFGGLI